MFLDGETGVMFPGQGRVVLTATDLPSSNEYTFHNWPWKSSIIVGIAKELLAPYSPKLIRKTTHCYCIVHSNRRSTIRRGTNCSKDYNMVRMVRSKVRSKDYNTRPSKEPSIQGGKDQCRRDRKSTRASKPSWSLSLVKGTGCTRYYFWYFGTKLLYLD